MSEINLTLKHFVAMSVIIHVIIILPHLDLDIFNSNIQNEFTNPQEGILKVTIVQDKILVVENSEVPFWESMEDAEWEKLVEESYGSCDDSPIENMQGDEKVI